MVTASTDSNAATTVILSDSEQMGRCGFLYWRIDQSEFTAANSASQCARLRAR